MINTNDDTLADRLRPLRNQGIRQRYRYEIVGHNYRPRQSVSLSVHQHLSDGDVSRIVEVAREAVGA